MMKFIQSLKILPRWIIILIDFFILFLSVNLAYLLRFNFDLQEIISSDFIIGALLFSVSGLLAIFITRSYEGIIRYTSLQDGFRIIYTISLSTGCTLLINHVNYLITDVNLIPISVVIIGYFNSVIFFFYYRFAVKYIFSFYSNAVHKKVNVIIYGAGQSGIITKNIIDKDIYSNLKVVAFAEDDRRKMGKSIDSLKIYNARKIFPDIFQTLKVNELIIAIQNLPLDRKNEIVDLCLKYNVKVRSVPPVDKWIRGELSLRQIRDVKIEDLLGRESIKLNNDNIKHEVRGKRVLITGAAGSIGSEIVRQIVQYQPESLTILDQAESQLHEINLEIASYLDRVDIHMEVADITNYERIIGIFNERKPELVYHAAAYKHVPIMEKNPSEAILCNVLGTKNLADISVQFKVERFVMISTDKAVNPTSVMGASKRIAEIYVQSINNHIHKELNHSTRFITTRFGNVLGSNGSVIPLFKRQIRNGGPVTVTHPDICRFFMTIPEACQLVLEAGAMGKGGEIFIFDMGKSIKIVDLAKKLIQLSGLRLDKDIKIKYTGLREGEKLFEELLDTKENTMPTHHPKIMVAKVREEPFNLVRENVAELISSAYTNDELYIVSLMKSIVPEFVSNYSRFSDLDKKKISI